MIKENGGSAFPGRATVNIRNPDGPNEMIEGEHGMSLRDYFAGQALVGLCRLDGPPVTGEEVSRRAFAIADDMLKERSNDGK